MDDATFNTIIDYAFKIRDEILLNHTFFVPAIMALKEKINQLWKDTPLDLQILVSKIRSFGIVIHDACVFKGFYGMSMMFIESRILKPMSDEFMRKHAHIMYRWMFDAKCSLNCFEMSRTSPIF